MPSGMFITGTDTGVGKTVVTLALMQILKKQGYRVAGMKPIATGAKWINGRLINEDACLIRKYCSLETDYDLVNPFVFEPAIAPHIAADNQSGVIEIEKIARAYKQLSSMNDITLVEGIGGWRVPVSMHHSLVDMVTVLKLPVMLVVGLRLGCINHALLTAEAICADGIELCGWLGNQTEKDYLHRDKTLETLTQYLDSSPVADLPWLPELAGKRIESYLDRVESLFTGRTCCELEI